MGRGEFGLYGLVDGMTVIVMLSYTMRLLCDRIVAMEESWWAI